MNSLDCWLGCIISLRLFSIKLTFLSVVMLSMKMLCAKYFSNWTAFNPLDHGRWFRLFTQNFIFFTTKWRTLINITFRCGQKVCLCVFWQTQRRNLKLVMCNLKYEKFWSVFLFNSTSSDETCKALTYNKFLISCCVQPKLVSAPLFSMVGNPLLQFFEWTLGGILSCLEARRFVNFDQITIQMLLPSRPIEFEFFTILHV